MNYEDLTIKEAKEISAMFGHNNAQPVIHLGGLDDFAKNMNVIVRTYSAGVWCGELVEKRKDEVILKNARRMWEWWCNESISLSAVAVHGINRRKSRIAPAVKEVWLMPIEIIKFSNAKAEESVMGANNAVAD